MKPGAATVSPKTDKTTGPHTHLSLASTSVLPLFILRPTLWQGPEQNQHKSQSKMTLLEEQGKFFPDTISIMSLFFVLQTYNQQKHLCTLTEARKNNTKSGSWDHPPTPPFHPTMPPPPSAVHSTAWRTRANLQPSGQAKYFSLPITRGHRFLSQRECHSFTPCFPQTLFPVFCTKYSESGATPTGNVIIRDLMCDTCDSVTRNFLFLIILNFILYFRLF